MSSLNISGNCLPPSVFCKEQISKNYIKKTIYWFRASTCSPLKQIIHKSIAIIICIFLALTILGLYPVYLGFKEWKRQVKIDNLEKIAVDSSDLKKKN
jgi:hypothetical protein